MKKQIKKYGSSVVITLSPDDLKFYGYKVGDWVEVEIVKIKKGERK